MNRRQYEATLLVALELYPGVHANFDKAQTASTALRMELARLEAKLQRAQAELLHADQELVQLHSEQQRTARSLLQRLKSSQLGHDAVHDLTQLLGVQHPAAAASFSTVVQE